MKENLKNAEEKARKSREKAEKLMENWSFLTKLG